MTSRRSRPGRLSGSEGALGCWLLAPTQAGGSFAGDRLRLRPCSRRFVSFGPTEVAALDSLVQHVTSDPIIPDSPRSSRIGRPGVTSVCSGRDLFLLSYWIRPTTKITASATQARGLIVDRCWDGASHVSHGASEILPH